MDAEVLPGEHLAAGAPQHQGLAEEAGFHHAALREVARTRDRVPVVADHRVVDGGGGFAHAGSFAAIASGTSSGRLARFISGGSAL